MGLYEIFKQKWSDPNTGNLTLTRKIGSGLLAGRIGAAVGNPADVTMDGKTGRGNEPLERIIVDGEPGDDCDDIAASVVRSDKGDVVIKRGDERRAGDPCDGELRNRVCGGGGVESGGCDKDKSDEHEGGGRGGSTV
ncbi:hypothetical protein L6452_05939 [Arctium lappa]|uniref:Uncharacterized protein n=1 Tax=Arctium lappa TaxID=4217 RepID=A0ACB9EH77_ARCLA|nr:hypothetical protein L6452_05939 [Arctium lappa]